MVIFWNELKLLRGLIVAWSVSVAVLILVMLPVYLGIGQNMMGSGRDELEQMVGSNAFLQSVDMTAEFLMRPIGMYGFINTWFFSLACAVLALYVGQRVTTLEFTKRSADFIYTKPYNRAQVFWSKTGAAASAVFIVGMTYVIASYVALRINLPNGFDFRLYLLLSFSLILIELVFLAMGIFVGVKWSRNRRPLLLAVTVVFLTVVVGTFATTIGNDWLLYLSPPKYFGGSIIADNQGYELKYLLWLTFLVTALMTSGHIIFGKKDIISV